jgi:hypothetical protein
MEALISVAAGKDLDLVLEDFARLQPSTYKQVGADRLPIPSEIFVPKRRKP